MSIPLAHGVIHLGSRARGLASTRASRYGCLLLLALSAYGCKKSKQSSLVADAGDVAQVAPDGSSVALDAAIDDGHDARIDVDASDLVEDAGAEGASSRPSLLRPSAGQTVYLHEPVHLSGDCGAAAETDVQGRFELSAPTERHRIAIEGTDVSHTFARPGEYQVSFVCLTESGRRRVSDPVSLSVRATPLIAYTAGTEGARRSRRLYGTSLDALGTARPLSPEGEPSATYSQLAYADSDDVLMLSAEFFDDQHRHFTIQACREDSCPDSRLVPAFVRGQGCEPTRYGLSPSGDSAWAYYSCSAWRGLYFFDLREGVAHEPRLLSSEGASPAYVNGGASLVFLASQNLWELAVSGDTEPVLLAEAVRSVRVAPDGQHFAATGASRVHFYGFEDGAPTSHVLADRALEHQINENAFVAPPSSSVLLLPTIWHEGENVHSDILAMRWDGTEEVSLCRDRAACTAAACGERAIVSSLEGTMLWDLSPRPGQASGRVAEGAPIVHRTRPPRFSSDCSRAVYAPRSAGQQGDVLIDLASGTFTSVPESSQLLSSRLLMTADNAGFTLRTIDAGLSVSEPVVDFRNPTQLVSAASASPDGRYIVFLANLEDASTRSAYKMRVEDYEVSLLAERLSGGAQVAFSSDGQHVAVAGYRGQDPSTGEAAINRVREYDLATSRLLWTSEAPRANRSSVYAVRRAPGTRTLVFNADLNATSGNRLYSVDVDTERLVAHTEGELTGQSLFFWTVSSDGPTLAFSTPFSTQIHRLDTASAVPVPLAQVHHTPPLQRSTWTPQVSLTSRGLLFEQGSERPLRWLDAASGEASDVLPAMQPRDARALVSAGPPSAAHGIAFEMMQEERVTNSVSTFELPDERSNAATRRVEATGATLTADERYLLYRETSGACAVFDLVAGTTRELTSAAGIGAPGDLCDDPYRQAKYAHGRMVVPRDNHELYLVDLGSARIEQRHEHDFAVLAGIGDDVSFAITCQNQYRDRAAIERLDLLTGEVRALAFVPRALRACEQTVVSPRGNWVLFEDQESGAYLTASSGSQPPVPLGVRVFRPQFDRAEHYLVAQPAGLSSLSLWSTLHPGDGEAVMHESLTNVDNVVWVD